MPRWLKIILISIGILFVILGSTFLYIYHNLDQLKVYALREVNKQLNTELSTTSIDISFWSTFPDVSLSFNDIKVADPLRPNKALLQAKHLYLGFNFYEILNKNYQIHLLSLEQGKLNLFVNEHNKVNYTIIKESDQNKQTKKEKFTFKLNKLELRNIDLNYTNLNQKISADLFISQTDLGGSFSESQFELSTHLVAQIQKIKSVEFEYFKNKKIQLTTSFQVNTINKTYTIGTSECLIDELALQIAGNIKQQLNNTILDISFSAKQLTIQNLLSILPFQIPEKLKSYKSNGSVYFKGSIKGTKSQHQMPSVLVNFGIDKGSFIDPETNVSLDNIALVGEFSNGEKKNLNSSYLALSKFEAVLGKQKLHGNLLFQNFENSSIQVDLNGGADLLDLAKFLKLEQIDNVAGELQFSFSIKGYQINNKWNWSDAFNQGLFKCKISTLKLKNLSKAITNSIIEAKYADNKIFFNKIGINIDQSSLNSTGILFQFMDFVMGKTLVLNGEFEIDSEKLNAEDLLIYQNNSDDEKKTEFASFSILLRTKVKQFIYNKFIANEVIGNFQFEPTTLHFDIAQMQTNGGILKGNGNFDFGKNEYVLKSKISGLDININELLKEFDNFGQEEITAKNLFGTLNSESEMAIYWDEKFNLLGEKMLMVSDLTLKNGQLINYTPLNSLSRFVDVNDLNNLKFSDLKNTITIKDKMMNIPAMDIKNNALNLTLSGTHTFENYLDYKVKLSLNELLSKKRKPQKDDFGEEDEKTNRYNLFISIKGPIDNLKFSYDNKAVKLKIKQDIKTEKENIKELFRNEFGIKKGIDSTFKKNEKKNEKEDELEFESN